ncbi:glutamyl-Q tRNA(Asp) ligase [Methylobacterium sp. Leaf125]|uniref:tRNA glutamyl-Q(34) synthetase GluQRS n=1 Tax=Methylobacterium sp. Leaf125 TaxID=1736265 RepID=UPI0006F671DE|nr:tRNA glutamyl-Q(34) synthetase GluQRS [Methylobacterium sp. Leaf125]KQQ26193.1 glutamyl-Q tRNA(Asp) ligase [Methylobacterium sp. Leaf125]
MKAPIFRFAPSPNGRLHLGHAACALLNDALARGTGGRLLLRIEDIDPVRSRPELIQGLRDDLAWLGLRFASPERRQSEHFDAYRRQVSALAQRGLAYPCFCSRGVIAAAAEAGSADGGTALNRDPDGAPLYPGTCRALPRGVADARRAAGEPHTWRLDTARALAAAPGPHRVRAFAVAAGEGRGPVRKIGTEWDEAADPARWGDPVIARRDVPTSYHLAVVMDDALQGISHVVRGADLRASTDLHVLLQALIEAPSPRYHHHDLLLDASGEKLAKSRGSQSLADLRASGESPADIRTRLGFA